MQAGHDKSFPESIQVFSFLCSGRGGIPVATKEQNTYDYVK